MFADRTYKSDQSAKGAAPNHIGSGSKGFGERRIGSFGGFQADSREAFDYLSISDEDYVCRTGRETKGVAMPSQGSDGTPGEYEDGPIRSCSAASLFRNCWTTNTPIDQNGYRGHGP